MSHLRIGNEEDGNLLYDAFMVYDLNGNRAEKMGERLGIDGKCQKMQVAYRYDQMNRLIEERREVDGDRYSYDMAGNRMKKQHYNYTLMEEVYNCDEIDREEGYYYNERNQLIEKETLSGITEYLYDENGSLVREKEGEKTAGYQYDLLNRQIYVKTLDKKEQENLYDGEGLRAGLKENGKITRFLFYNGEILTEYDGNYMPMRRHIQGVGLSHMQTMESDTYYTYHQDEQWSTVYVTESSGAVENCYIYDAFGNVLEKKEDIQSRILYTGQQYDKETGQYYLRARYYSPIMGRFMQEDTYRGDGLNLYAYCSNNPVIYYDPSGFGGKNNCRGTVHAEQEQTNDHSRSGAFDEAKRDAKIPQAQHPDDIDMVPMSQAEYEGGHVIKDDSGKVIMTREYHYTNTDGAHIVIQDHSAGHDKGNQGAHFNVRPANNTRTGTVPGTKDHYPFKL